ncbi:MAG: M23 family metallopeptidase [Oscillospiraceae bacterium]
MTDAYGWTVHPLTQKESFHSGVDLEAEAGQNVLAVAAGTVLDCSYSRSLRLSCDAGA